MFNLFPFKIAFRYFYAKKQERLVTFISAVSMLGVMIGVAALIVVMSVMNGFHVELSKNIIGLGGDINIYSYKRDIQDFPDVATIVSQHDAVSKVIPIINGQGLVGGSRNSAGVVIRGISLDDLDALPQVTGNIIMGNLMEFYNKNSIIIGSELAANIGARLGDRLKIISNNTVSTLVGTMPRAKAFNVVAIYQSGFYEYDASVIFMNIHSARTFMSVAPNDASALQITTNDPTDADAIASNIDDRLEGNLRVVSWQSQNEQFLNALKVERTAMFTILSLIIIVAAFNIVSSQFMLVRDKTKDIAILMTMGATPNMIRAIFMINGSIIGVIGTALGVILGVGFARNIDAIKSSLESLVGISLFDNAIYFLSHLPSQLEVMDIILVSMVSVLLCFLATLYPAGRAAKLNPVEALRYE